MRLLGLALSFALLVPTVSRAQNPSVPRVINITGVFRPADGQPPATTETITLSLYADQDGDTPLWQETQQVTFDDRGRYAVVLGATHPDGIPPSVFAAGAQWLGIVFARAGEVEASRVRLTSVPYALRAAEADTLGGHPASDYLLASEGTRAARDTAVASRSDVAGATGTANFVAKYVDSTNLTNSVLYDVGGVVGLGTTTPLDMFHVRFTNTGGNLTGLAVQNLGNTATSYSGMLFFDQNGALGQFQGFNNSTHEYRINNVARVSPVGAFNGSINFMVGGISRLFIGPTGHIGIGTTTPLGALDLSNALTGSPTTGVNLYNYGSDSFALGFNGRKARGTAAAPSAVLKDDTLLAVTANGFGTTAFGGVATAVINMRASENWTDAAHGSYISFSTTADGLTNPFVRMTLNASGTINIGGGPTAPPAVEMLQVFGDIRVGDSGSNGCIKDFSGTGIIGTCSSDRRLKKDITPFGSVLNQLTTLQPVHYYWRASEFPNRRLGDSQAAGLIAQDVEQVLPELVETDSDGYKAVNYSKLPLLTIQAMKELKAENDALKEQVSALKRHVENDPLKQRVAELERLLEQLLAGKK